MKGIKGVSARKLNLMADSEGQIWQRNYFDRIMRNYKEYIDTLNYMLMNSVKAGVVDDPWEYEGWYWAGWY